MLRHSRVHEETAAAVAPAGTLAWDAEQFAADRGGYAAAETGLLALANRYDGIDLPDAACRMVILAGLSVGIHLQERFLNESAKALSVLAERTRARITQGAGRATRNSTSDPDAYVEITGNLRTRPARWLCGAAATGPVALRFSPTATNEEAGLMRRGSAEVLQGGDGGLDRPPPAVPAAACLPGAC